MKQRAAFTLLEILIVIGVMAVLCGILIPVLASAKHAAYVTDLTTSLRQIQVARGMYEADYNEFSGHATDLVSGGYCPATLMRSRYDVIPEGLANVQRDMSRDLGRPVVPYKDSMLVLSESVGSTLIDKVLQSRAAGWLVVPIEPISEQVRTSADDLDVFAKSMRGRYLRLLENGAVLRRSVTWKERSLPVERYTSYTWLYTDDVDTFE